MSRIGRLPVVIPAGVVVGIKGNEIHVKGPKGEITRTFSPLMQIVKEGEQIIIKRDSNEPTMRSLHGTTRALISNMVMGVSSGFTKTLEVQGVGYRIELVGKKVILYVGYSHPVPIEPPEGIAFELETKTRLLKVSGCDKELVGQIAANIRAVRPPEPYKGKGIRYEGERVRRKAGKTAKGK